MTLQKDVLLFEKAIVKNGFRVDKCMFGFTLHNKEYTVRVWIKNKKDENS
jgi:hypothetical protein